MMFIHTRMNNYKYPCINYCKYIILINFITCFGLLCFSWYSNQSGNRSRSFGEIYIKVQYKIIVYN